MRFKQLRAVWVHVELILCIISSFSLEIVRVEHLDIGNQVAFIFSCERKRGKWRKRHEIYSLFFVVLSMRKQERKGRLGYILQERSSCWHIVFWGSSCKEDSG